MDRIQTVHKMVETPDKNDYIIELATMNNIDELEKLYNDLNDFLELGTNYAGWKKGVYPIRQTAVNGIENNNLFVLKINNEIAGSIILNHEQASAYSQGNWEIEANQKEIIVIHTFAVNPKYIKNGIGKKLMDFAKSYSIKRGMKTIRLDVSIYNTPAISLYEKCGYKYIGTVDLELTILELIWFRLYELVL